MRLRAKSLIGRPGKHPRRDTSRRAARTAAEAGASTLYCTVLQTGEISISLKEVFHQKAAGGSCLDD